MLKLLGHFLFGSRHPKTRMTRERVAALAADAAVEAGIDHAFLEPTVRRVDDRLTWTVSTATIGSGWSIEIDDSTGEVGLAKRWGIR